MKATINNGKYLTGYAVYTFIPSQFTNKFVAAHVKLAQIAKKKYQPQPVGSRCRIAKKIVFHVAEPEEVEVELVKTNSKTCWVRLPDRHVVKRHLKKHGVK